MTDTLWYTRCPVPTASGLAHSLGWLGDAAARAGLEFGVLQDAGPELAGHHFLHDLSGLIREGGNVPALAARAQGSPTRLIGLTWIDEAQAILVGPQSSVGGPAELAGLRVGVPAWAQDQARSFPARWPCTVSRTPCGSVATRSPTCAWSRSVWSAIRRCARRSR